MRLMFGKQSCWNLTYVAGSTCQGLNVACRANQVEYPWCRHNMLCLWVDAIAIYCYESPKLIACCRRRPPKANLPNGGGTATSCWLGIRVHQTPLNFEKWAYLFLVVRLDEWMMCAKFCADQTRFRPPHGTSFLGINSIFLHFCH